MSANALSSIARNNPKIMSSPTAAANAPAPTQSSGQTGLLTGIEVAPDPNAPVTTSQAIPLTGTISTVGATESVDLGPHDVPTRPNPVNPQRAAYVAAENDQDQLDPSGDALNKPRSRFAASRALGSTF